VIGGSAGALPALAFAIRHPDRCAALAPIVPAAYAPNRPQQEPLSPLAAAIIEHGLKSDFLFWLGLKTAERSMMATLLATDPDIIVHASAAEQARARAILWNILPVSARADGLRNDAFQTAHAQAMALDRITAPTLTISLEDDRFGAYAAARHIAANIRGARFVSYPTGGHIWIGHDRDLFGEIDAFLRAL
jgi:pimeloyl-ACP methyl ester carboxylesterase